MSSGLIALLDDVAGLAKVAAASLDDVAGQATRAGVKAAGVVIDDTAVTPRFVAGLAPSRELPIVWRITLGSLRNKLLYLLPVALALGLLAPWAITPLLMVGGAYLCLEGAEKVIEAVRPHRAAEAAPKTLSPAAMEEARVTGAIRTDFILSAEIMAVTLATVPDEGVVAQALVLGSVGIFITFAVYGTVALIVKADDAGLALSRMPRRGLRVLGMLLVRGTVPFLQALSVAGTAAMLWVGGGIVLHGMESLGVPGPAQATAMAAQWMAGTVSRGSGFAGWLAVAAIAGFGGLALGLLLAGCRGMLLRPAMQLLRSR